MRQSGCRKWVLLFFSVFILAAFKADAQADLPFRNPSLSDETRIADLLERLTFPCAIDGSQEKLPASKWFEVPVEIGCQEIREADNIDSVALCNLQLTS